MAEEKKPFLLSWEWREERRVVRALLALQRTSIIRGAEFRFDMEPDQYGITLWSAGWGTLERESVVL